MSTDSNCAQNPPQVRGPRDDRPLWKRLLPFVVATTLTAGLLWHLNLSAFIRHLGRVNYVGFLAFVAVFNLVLLAADSLATTYVYRRTICDIKTREFFLIRGASYLVSLVNHHVGQAWLTWYMSRVYKAPLGRVAGATLLVYATTFGSLFLFAGAALFFDHRQQPWLAPVVAAGTAAGLGYLAIIHIAPPFLARRQVLAPLFEVGVRGHVEALVLRIPHMVVQFLGCWIPFYFFGIHIPAGAAFAYCPLLMVVQALPLTPQGVGTRDWFSLLYFSDYASGPRTEQEAAVVATTLTFAVALSLLQIVFSLILMKRVLKALAKPQDEPVAEPRPAASARSHA